MKASTLCAWEVGDYWHVQSRDPWLSGVLLDMGMTKIARAIKGPHLNIFETDQGIEAVRPLLRRHKGRILRGGLCTRSRAWRPATARSGQGEADH